MMRIAMAVAVLGLVAPAWAEEAPVIDEVVLTDTQLDEVAAGALCYFNCNFSPVVITQVNTNKTYQFTSPTLLSVTGQGAITSQSNSVGAVVVGVRQTFWW